MIHATLHTALAAAVAGAWLAGTTRVWAVEGVRTVEAAGTTAVVVDDLPLVHTGQFAFVPADAAAAPPLPKQLADVMAQLATALAAHGSGLDDIVRLHVCAASDEVARRVTDLLPALFGPDHRHALTCVVGGLPDPGSLVAVDAVAVARRPAGPGVTGDTRGMVLPPGTRCHVSGQAQPGDSPAAATTATLVQLADTLRFLGRSRRDVVQLKAFVNPITAAAEVRRAVETFFTGQPVPPLVIVEWKAGPPAPVEIELVAWGGPARSGADLIEFLTPPGMKASPIYARVVRTTAPRTIYVGGLLASPPPAGLAPPAAAEREVREVFATLRAVVEKAGSDLTHLVKATYYVANEPASTSLNALRPDYYDPRRPPAASKALVTGVGRPDVGLLLDMIAVPTGTTAPAP